MGVLQNEHREETKTVQKEFLSFCCFMYDPFSSILVFAAKGKSYTCGNDSESSFFLDDFDRSMGILETSYFEAV